MKIIFTIILGVAICFLGGGVMGWHAAAWYWPVLLSIGMSLAMVLSFLPAGVVKGYLLSPLSTWSPNPGHLLLKLAWAAGTLIFAAYMAGAFIGDYMQERPATLSRFGWAIAGAAFAGMYLVLRRLKVVDVEH